MCLPGRTPVEKQSRYWQETGPGQPGLGNQQAQECGPWPEKSLKIQVSKSGGKKQEEAPGRLKEGGQAGGMGTF